jgi:hypothetical protein
MSEDKREDLGEGHEPNEIAGPDGSGSTPITAEFKPGELDAPPQEAHFQSSDEVGESFLPEPIAMIPSPEDGLPVPADESSSPATAPPFTYETVVCIEDARSYVSVFAEEIEQRLPGEMTVSKPAAGAADWMEPLRTLRYGSIGDFDAVALPRYDAEGQPRPRLSFDPARVERRFGVTVVQLTEEEQDGVLPRARRALASARSLTLFYVVRPLREQCVHYRSQVFGNDDEPDVTRPGHRIVFSNCMVRRSVGGAMMSLRDEAVYACEHRYPPDPETVDRYLTQWNKERLLAAKHLVRVQMFNLPPVTHRHAESGLPVKAQKDPT